MPRNYVRKTDKPYKKTKSPTRERLVGDRTIDDEDCYVNDNWSHIRPATRDKRRVFVSEFLKDFNGMRAMMRSGFVDDERRANQLSKAWLEEPFTQYLIDHVCTQLEESDIVTRKQVMARLWQEANRFNHGPDQGHGARIKALSVLAKIKGMEITKIEATVTHGGGVMLIPATMSPEQWEEQAKAQQSHLREIARN